MITIMCSATIEKIFTVEMCTIFPMNILYGRRSNVNMKDQMYIQYFLFASNSNVFTIYYHLPDIFCQNVHENDLDLYIISSQI